MAKQQTRELVLTTKSWLYGIDKARRYIRKYRTIILVEGIFDYFAFCNLLQDQDKPVVNAISGFSLKHLKTDAKCASRGQGVKMISLIS